MSASDSLKTREILECLRSLQPELRERHGVVSLEIFGSRIHSRQRPESDVGLLVEFDEAPGLLTFLALESELAAQLGRPVDLVHKGALQRRIGRAIRAEAIPV
jgi:uncharacterized protein